MRRPQHIRTNGFAMNSGAGDHRERPYLNLIKARKPVVRAFRYVSDVELIRGCTRYENAAWHELIRRYGQAMYAAITKQLAWSLPSHNGVEAEDILGKVFERLLERDCEVLRNLRDAGVIRAYLCQIARTVTLDCLRQEPIELPVPRPHELYAVTIDPYETIAIRENYRRLQRTLEKLPDRQRLFLKLRYEEELAYKEIAELTRTPINTVGTILHRARKAAKKLLKKRGISLSRKVEP